MGRCLSFWNLFFIAAIVVVTGQSRAGEIRVAVASNFSTTMLAITTRFESNTGHKVKLVPGSSGKHYAQIINGAPIDLFFAADIHRPEKLEKEGRTISGTRFTYALGKLVLWSPKVGKVDFKGNVLEHGKFRHLAIANPKLAPYGKAAEEVLKSRGLLGVLGKSLVRGENIGQTFQFVESGNAELGFVAYSQLKNLARPAGGSFWEVPQVLYTPIEQQAVLLRESKIGREFLFFFRCDEILELIHFHGYETP